MRENAGTVFNETTVFPLPGTQPVTIVSSIAGVELLTKITLYYGHERVWAAIPWGRH